MSQHALNEIYNELIFSLKNAGHPFRFFVFTTISTKKTPRSRTVVLRGIDDNFKITFFTDARSQKVMNIKNNQAATALFYHPEKRIQVIFSGKAHLETDQQTINTFWDTLASRNLKDYSTQQPPGTALKAGLPLEFLQDAHHFAVINLIPEYIETLQLNPQQHKRMHYRKDGKLWLEKELVP